MYGNALSLETEGISSSAFFSILGVGVGGSANFGVGLKVHMRESMVHIRNEGESLKVGVTDAAKLQKSRALNRRASNGGRF